MNGTEITEEQAAEAVPATEAEAAAEMPAPAFAVAVEGRALADALAMVLPAANKRGHLPVLVHVLMDVGQRRGDLTLTCTDLDIRATATLTETIVDAEGRAMAPARELAAFLRGALKGGKKAPASRVRLESGGTIGTPTVTASVLYLSRESIARYVDKTEWVAGPRATWPAFPAEEFPLGMRNLEASADVAAAEMDGDTFAAAVDSVTYAASTDGTRPVLNGVNVEMRRCVAELTASDGHRLAHAVVPCGGDEAATDSAAVLPVPALVLTSDACKGKHRGQAVRVEIRHNRKNATDTGPGMALADLVVLTVPGRGLEVETRTLEGPFPNYRQVVPGPAEIASSVHAALDPTTVGAALGRIAAAVHQDPARATQLTLRNGGEPPTCELRSLNGDVHAEETIGVLAVDYPPASDGKSEEPRSVFTVGFNAWYLADALKHLAADGGPVDAHFGGKGNPVLLVPRDARGTRARYALVMPLRLAD